jgi:hypothetical protein
MNERINRNDPELVILPRPQISVALTDSDEIEIATTFIGDDYGRVEHGEVLIPLESVQEVAEAMLAILKQRGG